MLVPLPHCTVLIFTVQCTKVLSKRLGLANFQLEDFVHDLSDEQFKFNNEFD